MIVLLLSVLTLAYKYNENSTNLKITELVYNETYFELQSVKTNLTSCQVVSGVWDINQLMSNDLAKKFCKSNGYDYGGISSYSCSGGMTCFKIQSINNTQVTTESCFKLSEVIDYARR